MKTDPRAVATAFVSTFTTMTQAEVQRECFSPECDEHVILSNLVFAEKLFPRSALMLCPISHAGFKYISKNSDNILGHTQASLQKKDLAELFELVHPEDLPAVKQCFEFIRSCEPYDPATHRFVMHYRMRTSNGSYHYIKDENLSLKTANGKYLYIMMFTNIADEKFHHVRMDIYRQLKGVFVKAYSYNPRQTEQSITPRQNDIIRLIIKGFTNQQIADQLNVSIFTVKNHKRMLFRRVNVKNSIELASAVGRGAI